MSEKLEASYIYLLFCRLSPIRTYALNQLTPSLYIICCLLKLPLCHLHWITIVRADMQDFRASITVTLKIDTAGSHCDTEDRQGGQTAVSCSSLYIIRTQSQLYELICKILQTLTMWHWRQTAWANCGLSVTAFDKSSPLLLWGWGIVNWTSAK